jgi:hypothetical protein
MSTRRATVLSVLLVAAVAIPAAAHAAGERRANLRAQREMDALTSVVGSVSLTAGSERRVTLNGAPLFFRKATERGTLDEVMARVAKECASGTEASAFGLTRNIDDGVSKPIELERVFSQESEGGVRASLCIFANENGAPNEELHRARYTLAHARDDGSVAVTTVVNASATPLQELFPVEGDAPGSDLEGVARPAQSRRTLTAVVGTGGEYAVRVYESPLDVSSAVTSYDRQMSTLGYATTGTLEDARMYRKDGRSYVASFRGTTGGSTVALLPFGAPISD